MVVWLTPKDSPSRDWSAAVHDGEHTSSTPLQCPGGDADAQLGISRSKKVWVNFAATGNSLLRIGQGSYWGNLPKPVPFKPLRISLSRQKKRSQFPGTQSVPPIVSEVWRRQPGDAEPQNQELPLAAAFVNDACADGKNLGRPPGLHPEIKLSLCRSKTAPVRQAFASEGVPGRGRGHRIYRPGSLWPDRLPALAWTKNGDRRKCLQRFQNFLFQVSGDIAVCILQSYLANLQKSIVL